MIEGLKMQNIGYIFDKLLRNHVYNNYSYPLDKLSDL